MFKAKIRGIVESKFFGNFILAVIIINSISIGIETYDIGSQAHTALAIFDKICLGIYILEIAMKLITYKGKFFRDGWNIFDFIIVALCLIPTNLFPFPPAVVRMIRIFRVFRMLRLISSLRPLRVIVMAIGKSMPGVSWTAFLLLIIFYIFAVIGTMLFKADFPEWFGTIGASFYTLFQVMTLESWSMGIARPVIEVIPLAWLYFVPFVMLSSFIVVNVVVGIIVGTIDEANAELNKTETLENADSLECEFIKLKQQIDKVETLIKESKK